MKLAFVFPGQGAQYVGMGSELAREFPLARKIFEEADAALGFPLSALFQNGPEDSLRLTYNAQPALMTVSIAAYRVFCEQANAEPVVVAGHSLGEYSALVAAQAITFEAGVKLVRRRGQLMEKAVPAGVGAMSAVLGMEADELKAVCQGYNHDGAVVELANLNCPGQIVIAGTADAVAQAGAAAKERGARRVIPLAVSGPFHCSLMRPAAKELMNALNATDFKDALYPVVANFDAELYTTPDKARQVLHGQLYSPVLWEQDVRRMLDLGVDGFIEFGPGTVLSGLVKKIDRRIPTFHVEDSPSMAAALEAATL